MDQWKNGCRRTSKSRREIELRHTRQMDKGKTGYVMYKGMKECLKSTAWEG